MPCFAVTQIRSRRLLAAPPRQVDSLDAAICWPKGLRGKWIHGSAKHGTLRVFWRGDRCPNDCMSRMLCKLVTGQISPAAFNQKKPTKRGRFRPTRQISLSAQPTKERMRIHWDSKLLAWATRHLPGSVPARPFCLCGQEDSDVAAMQCKHQFHRGCISRRLRAQKPAGFTSQMTWLVKTPRFKEMGIADL